ncbi:hypothetical protein CI610_03521 [invertebrate metagenome]|uniref:Uncharacterized protein n=1 Tax=invertebrate metagenome TaxID=1711999 RepID=A0A2H9T2V1_9ZZZZ
MSGFLLSVHQQFERWLWNRCLSRSTWFQRGLQSLLRTVYAVSRDLASGQLSLQAMSLVYTTLLSMVPLLALSFSVLKGFGVHNQIEPLLLNLLEPLGDKRIDIVNNVIQFVDNIKVGVLGTLGFALLLYSVIAMVQKIERAFNGIWHIQKGRSFSRRFSDYLSVIFVGPLLIFVSVGITAAIRNHEIVNYFATLPGAGLLIRFAGIVIPWLLMAAAFVFIYVYIPYTRVSVKAACTGGLITAVAWKVMGWGFASFIASSTQQTAIYSFFASAILLMIWIYMGWLMLLVGASITFYQQYPQNRRMGQSGQPVSHSSEEKLALIISVLIANRFMNGGAGLTISDLSDQLKVPEYRIQKGVNQLEAIGFLVRIAGVHECQVQPARSLDSIYVQEVIDGLYRLGANVLPVCASSMVQLTQDYLEQHQSGQNEQWEEISYQQWIKAITHRTG